MNKYAWAQGYPGKVNPDVAGRVCEKLEAEGCLTAAALLAESVDEEAPLHKAFNWDNDSAAHQYRLMQARLIISNLRVVRNEDERPTKKFYSIVRDDPSYQSIEVIMSQQDTRDRLLRNSRRDFQTFKEKYETLQEWAETIELGSQV